MHAWIRWLPDAHPREWHLGTRRGRGEESQGIRAQKRAHSTTDATMKAIKVETTVDEATALAIPALRPLLGQRVELIALQTEGEPTPAPPRRLTLDELLAARLTPRAGVSPTSFADMEKAIERGATGASD